MHTAQRAKSALSALAKGAVKVGAGMTMGLKGAEVAEDLLSSSSSNVVKDLRKALEGIVDNVVKRKEILFDDSLFLLTTWIDWSLRSRCRSSSY